MIEMKTRLSTPSTISSAVSVSRATSPSVVRKTPMGPRIIAGPPRRAPDRGAPGMIDAMRIAAWPRGAALIVLIVTFLAAAAAGATTADDLLAQVRRHTERYQDVARARADGFVAGGGMVALHGIHFVNPA